jgi:hypothetical protein
MLPPQDHQGLVCQYLVVLPHLLNEHVCGGRNQAVGMLHPATLAILVVSTTLNTWTTLTTFPCVNRFIINLSSTPTPSHLPCRLLLARVNSQYLVDTPNKLCAQSTEQTSFGVQMSKAGCHDQAICQSLVHPCFIPIIHSIFHTSVPSGNTHIKLEYSEEQVWDGY